MSEKIASQGLPLHSIDYAHSALRNMLLMLITAGALGEDELQNKQNENYQNFFLIVMQKIYEKNCLKNPLNPR